MRGLAAAGLTVNDTTSSCARIFTSIVGWNTRLRTGAGCRPSEALSVLQEGARLLAGGERQGRAAADADSVIPIVEAKRCDLITSDHAVTTRSA
jgi:hypothetical protein